MKKLFILFIILTSCKNESKKEKDFTFSKKVNVSVLGLDILIPKDYKEITFENFEKELLKIDKSSAEVSFESIEKIKHLKNDIVLFVNNKGVENFIIVLKGEYINLNKNISSIYYNMLKESSEQSWSMSGIDYELLEKRYIQTNSSKIIKIKYVLKYDESNKYITNYLISSKNKTFTITVNNFQNVDFENLFKKI